jgi:cobalt/nickel transport system permease protein
MSLHLHALDAYRAGSSPVHRYDSRLKLALVLLFVASVALTPNGAWPAYVLLGALALGVVLLSRLGMGYVQRRAALAAPFVLAAVTVVFTTAGRSLLATRVLGWDLALTDAGVVRFASIVLKSWLSVQAAVVLTASTPFPELLRAMRSLCVPRVLVGILGFTYRYLFVIGDEALRMMRARAARSGVPVPKGSGESLPSTMLRAGFDCAPCDGACGTPAEGPGLRSERRTVPGETSPGRQAMVPQTEGVVLGGASRARRLSPPEGDAAERAQSKDVASPGKVGGSLLWRARVTGGMAGSLFLRSIERGERIYGAMVARGYDGEVRLLRSPPLRARQLLAALPLVLLLMAVPVLARMM